MFNDANSDPTLPGRLVDRNRVTVNPETGDVIETGGHVNLDPVIITGKMPDNLKRTINKNIESNRLQDLLYKDRLSPVDPVGELVVESAAIGKPLELAGKAAKQHGMSVQGFANRVLRNPSKYSAAMRKKANFAHNAAGWKH